MKNYRKLSIIEKINFKSWVIANRLAHWGKDGITPMFHVMSYDGISLQMPLRTWQYSKPRSINYK